jgi:hypothetical protein
MATCALLNFDFDNGLSRGTCSDLPQTAGPAGPRTGKGPFSPIGPGPAIFAGPLKHCDRGIHNLDPRRIKHLPSHKCEVLVHTQTDASDCVLSHARVT